MPIELLAELKKLQHQRSESSPFANHVEFHTWADKIIPLLSFDPKLQSQFKSMVSATKSARLFEIKQQEIENINSAIGMVNQAITLLEINPINNSTANPANEETPDGTERQHPINLWQRPIGAAWVIVFGGVILAFVIYLIKTHLGIPL